MSLVIEEEGTGSIEDYVFGESLGEGSYSSVHEAIHKQSCVRVAIKTISLTKANRVQIDAELVQKRLVHKNVVKVVDVLRTEDNLYLVMEFIPGGSLDNILEAQKLEMCEIWWYFWQLITALDYLHCSNICHRDVKPSNILLTVHRTLKLSDFGECLELSVFHVRDGPRTHESRGTHLFFSPQMASGGSYDCMKADMWAAGVTLYLMLSGGKYPFSDEKMMDLFHKIERAEFTIPDLAKRDPSLLELLCSLLAKDENARLTAPQVLKHEWLESNMQEYTAAYLELNEAKPILDRWKTFSILPYAVDAVANGVGGEEGVDLDPDAGDGAAGADDDASSRTSDADVSSGDATEVAEVAEVGEEGEEGEVPPDAPHSDDDESVPVSVPVPAPVAVAVAEAEVEAEPAAAAAAASVEVAVEVEVVDIGVGPDEPHDAHAVDANADAVDAVDDEPDSEKASTAGVNAEPESDVAVVSVASEIPETAATASLVERGDGFQTTTTTTTTPTPSEPDEESPEPQDE